MHSVAVRLPNTLIADKAYRRPLGGDYRLRTVGTGSKRTHVDIDGYRFLLDPSQDVEALKQQIVNAVTTRSTFVHIFSGAESAMVLATPRSKVVVTVDHGRDIEAEEMPPTSHEDWYT